jgi:hypothetical protein
MTLSIKLIPQFTHKSPPGMHYEVEEYERNIFQVFGCVMTASLITIWANLSNAVGGSTTTKSASSLVL